jgi:uncharacterized membrane protein
MNLVTSTDNKRGSSMLTINANGKLVTNFARKADDEMDISIAREIKNRHEVGDIVSRINKAAEDLLDIIKSASEES